jgi:hypothetical protein
MNEEALGHLERIGMICERLDSHPTWGNAEAVIAYATLTDFDSKYFNFAKYLSPSLYSETLELLASGAHHGIRPRLAVIMPVYKPRRELLRQAVGSVLNQVGVETSLLISLDGPEGKRPLVEQVLAELEAPPGRVRILTCETNRGVGLCRNQALREVQEQWFTFLDGDDVFHPLRCLHGWLALRALDVKRLNTGYSRVCLRTGKIVLQQQGLSAVGGNSFIACSELIRSHGYLAPLRFYEDTEYENRLGYFGVPMTGCSAVGHYQNTELDPGYTSLATRWRVEAHAIEGHPWLHGTVVGAIDRETEAIRDHYNSLYAQLAAEDLSGAFPAEPITRAAEAAWIEE